MVTMWALRLIAHLASRYKGVEDRRFTKVVRERWSGMNPASQAAFCFHYIFVSQAIYAMLVNGSAMHILVHSTKEDKIKDDPIVITGAVVWALGFLIEFFADLQMIDYQDLVPSKRPAVLKTGLWRYSRHPNYFGEILCWLGIYIIACSGNSAKTGGALTFYSPLVITFLLNNVTGVPLMEQSKMKSKDYRIYIKETNSIIPWLPCPVEDKDRKNLMDQIEKEIKKEAKRDTQKAKTGIFYWLKFYLLIE